MIRRTAISTIGRGIFTRELEEALLANRVDLAVHSAKDLTTQLPAGLVIGALIEREDPRDCLVARGGLRLSELPAASRIGTSSLRRRAQLVRLRNDLKICEMRGNIDSRLRKVERGEIDGVVLAHAGLKRLGLSGSVSEVFDCDTVLPQPAQGAIAVEGRLNDSDTKELMELVNHMPTFYCVAAERSFLDRLEGGCQIPTGISSQVVGSRLNLKGAIFSLDGNEAISGVVSDLLERAVSAGSDLAAQILQAGGRRVLDEIRAETKN